MRLYNFTEANETQHTLRVETLNRIELNGDRVRVAYANEILMFTFKNEKEALKIYKELVKELEGC